MNLSNDPHGLEMAQMGLHTASIWYLGQRGRVTGKVSASEMTSLTIYFILMFLC